MPSSRWSHPHFVPANRTLPGIRFHLAALLLDLLRAMLVFQITPVTRPLFSVATVATAFGPRMTFGCSHFTEKTWEELSPKSSHPPARHGHCGTSCYLDSRTHALFFGGASATGSLMSDVWALSLGPNYTWRKFTPASLLQPSPRMHSACVCLSSSSFIVFGGRDFLGANGEIWMMNLPTRTWKILHSITPMPGPSFGTCFHALGPPQ